MRAGLTELLLLGLLEVLASATSINLVLLLVTMVDERVNGLDQLAKLLLLTVELAFDAVKASHELLNLLIRLLLADILITLRAVQDMELVAELLLNILRVGTLLVLLLAVDRNEVGKVGALLALADLDHDAHDDVFEGVFALALLLS